MCPGIFFSLPGDAGDVLCYWRRGAVDAGLLRAAGTQMAGAWINRSEPMHYPFGL